MADPVLLNPPVTRWHCPSCDVTDVTRQFGVHSRMHTCAGLKGLTAPLLEEGVSAKHTAVERGDYTNGDLVQTDENGRVVMSVTTTRDDGEDCTVYAPAASASIEQREN
jgi:hypothetical protein